MRTVTFQIKGVYIDQIKAGSKVEEYRSISEHNTKLLCDHIDKKELQPGEHYVTHKEEIWRVKKDLTHVRLFNGYRSDRKELIIELKCVEINEFINFLPEGMKPGTICFTLFLGRIVSSKNF
jgi:hypothetical protein